MSVIDKSTQFIHLKDGRRLSYSEYGYIDGKPVFLFHGWVGSRMEGAYLKNQAIKHNIRLITPDRPGIGYSDLKKERSFLDWQDDLLELADGLRIDKFAVIGMSGGGPYAAAAAYKIPTDHLVATAIVCGQGKIDLDLEGMNPQNIQIHTIMKEKSLEEASQFLDNSMGQMYQSEEKTKQAVQRMRDFLPEPDRKILSENSFLEIFIADGIEGFRQGSLGPAIGGKLYTKPWGFNLKDIKAKVYLFHGEQDVNIPVQIGRKIAKSIPNCEATFYPDEGHMSLIANRFEEIIKNITILL
jgi:pimeloyl-ACP methyl ester carboxylesterase